MFDENVTPKDSPFNVTEKEATCGTFLGKSGQLYIRVHRVQPTPAGQRFTEQTAVYPSINAYNDRSARPDYKPLAEVEDDFDRPVTIDMTTLTIALPLPD